ncbi:hypothetical protein P4597_07685 [Peribacillus simplex]|uniref:hypothetical protein n=1 Tax=Peribacillus simplex TaxID=1478 RepID=UPI002E244642|nr:hypothetical protein [Peribacillus simplex]
MKFNEGELVIIGFGIGTIILSILRLADLFQSSIAIAGFSIAGATFVLGDFAKYFSEYMVERKKTKWAKFLRICFVLFYTSSPVIAFIGFFFAIDDPDSTSASWSRIGDFSTLLSMGLIFTLLIVKNKIIKHLEGIALSLDNSTIHAERDINITVKQY